ncbi:hypothetical protein Q7P36_010304 [Cladosporium allicinum]
MSWRLALDAQWLQAFLQPNDNRPNQHQDNTASPSSQHGDMSPFALRHLHPLLPLASGPPSDSLSRYKRTARRICLRRALFFFSCIALMALGLLHVLQSLARHGTLLWTGETLPPSFTSTLSLASALHSAEPVPCHSHNDYWRPRPLLDAISTGCTSVEADVWLIDDQLYVGHGLRSVDRNKSLSRMYLHPLLDMLDQQTGHSDAAYSPSPVQTSIFYKQPNQTLVLLVDFKNSGADAFRRLHQDLEPLRNKGYLTYHDGGKRIDGPVTVVTSGQKTSFDSILANTIHRDIFFDAPLERLWQPPRPPLADTDRRTFTMDYASAMADDILPASDLHVPFDTTNSFYASTSFRSAVGYVWRGHLSPRQMRIIRGQINGARSRGLKVRYWDTPTWPIALRNHIWHVLAKEGVDFLSVDDLEGCAKSSWKAADKHGWSGWWSE